MPLFGSSRRRTIALLAAGAFVIAAALTALQAFDTSRVPFLTPRTTWDILLFSGISVVAFLLLLLLLILLIRNILKLFVDQRSRALGSRLRTRLVIGAALIALAPAAFMFLFSLGLMNRSVDRWFSQPTAELRENSTRVVLELAHYATSNARLEAEAIAASGALDTNATTANAELRSRRITLEGGFVAVYGPDKQGILGYQLPAEASHRSLLPWLDDGKAETVVLHGPVFADLLMIAQRSDEPILIVDGGDEKREYATSIAATPAGRLIVVGLPMPQGLSETASQIRIGASEYWTLFRSRNSIRTTFFFVLLLITALVFFSSMWLALFLSKQITRPVEALADAMDEIADGRLDKRVAVESSGEMAELVRAFNHMAQDLETSRHMAESSREQLSAANQALEERRRELETILETIPSGVVTLDKNGAILLANRAFAALMGLDGGRGEESHLSGRKIDTLFPADCSDDLARVIRRSYRMGAASTEVETTALGRAVHLAVTSARLELGPGKQGAVLVVEDTTELLRAQRQLAWKEVAQRVAHEIKNPLTPIALSAERIRKHLDRATDDSPSVIRKCSEVILGCVGTLRTLVDQFAALAQFPAPQPRPCDMNQILEDAMLLFSGRMEGITIRQTLEPGLPPVMADPDAVKRALANLIDNAAEAMQTSLLRVLTVTTALSEDGSSVEVAVSDTGHGLTDEIRERLFLPFYSTKQRGTGLGLSIAAKIAQEHHGSIRAETNAPKGARFLLCLPVMEGSVMNGRTVLTMQANREIRQENKLDQNKPAQSKLAQNEQGQSEPNQDEPETIVAASNTLR
ncbi:sensor histidine kinase [Acidicapsa ligni]|uniref:sensor histidine kinase n=1 Tax=Acidicapsa ligni TaxID=542300 RepID=UPI0021E0992B|nr:ATP-binding protein [Acidicapsa ligni]